MLGLEVGEGQERLVGDDICDRQGVRAVFFMYFSNASLQPKVKCHFLV